MAYRLGEAAIACGLTLALGIVGQVSAQAVPTASATPPARCDGTALWDARLGRCVEDPRLKCASGDLAQCVAVGDHYRDRSSTDHDLRLAMTYYQRACDGHELRACHALGLMEIHGEAGPRDTLAALRRFQRGCDGGHVASCTRVGELRAARAPDAAIAQWTQACAQADARACVLKAEHATEGSERCAVLSDACQADEPLGCALLARNVAAAECSADAAALRERVMWACAQDEPEACYRLALLTPETPAIPTLRARLAWACEVEHRESCVLMAQWSIKGTHGPISQALAEQHADRACALGDMRSCMDAAEAWIARSHSTELAGKIDSGLSRACAAQTPHACRRLGDVLFAGEVLVRDRARAEQSYGLACDQGDALACAQLGDIHGYRAAQSDDEGARKRDLARAAVALDHACRLRHARACVRFALLALHGIESDEAEAQVALLTACSAGAPEGCFYAGQQLALGRGVSADAERATALLSQACSAGSVLACQDLENGQLSAKLTQAHAFPMPYASGTEVPAAHLVPVASTTGTETNMTMATAHDAAEATGSAASVAPEFTWGVDIGFNGQNDAQAARLIVHAGAPIAGRLRVHARAPMVVAEARLDIPEGDPSGLEFTSASTFRLGNVLIGADHDMGDSANHITWRFRYDLVLPTALAPGDLEEVTPTLERQLAVRAYQLANAIDGARDAWLYRPNRFGAVVGVGLEHVEARWLASGSAALAGSMPVRGELNGELILQVDAMLAARLGPALLGAKAGLSLISDDEMYVPSLTALVAVEDEGERLWSLRATLMPADVGWDVPAWGVSASVGHVLP